MQFNFLVDDEQRLLEENDIENIGLINIEGLPVYDGEVIQFKNDKVSFLHNCCEEYIVSKIHDRVIIIGGRRNFCIGEIC